MPNSASSSVFDLYIFAGGGSGGHLFPGLAIAERIRESAPDAHMHFLCSSRPLDRSILTDANSTFTGLPAAPLTLRPFPAAAIRFIRGWRQSQAITKDLIRSSMTDASRVRTIALGGFVAAPVVRAAHHLGSPVLMVNLDAVPGKANTMMARWADRIVSAVPTPRNPRFDQTIVGMPIRRAAVATTDQASCREALGLSPDKRTLLVTGASQGAGTLNEVMIDLCRSGRKELVSWQVLHLCGPDKVRDELEQAYRAAGIQAVVMPFCNQMNLAWGASTLALSRSGASSVAEAIANRVPTVFAPYPWHKDLHQKYNAQPYVEQGLGWLVEDRINRQLNAHSIGDQLLTLMSPQYSSVEQTAARLRRFHVVDAAQAVASLAMSGR